MSRSWTPSQEAAMSLSGKTLLVSAAAGSGKTSVLTERIIRKLINREADLSRLLVVTFTRAAAAELKGRIASALSDALAEKPGDDYLSRQLLLLGSAQISTIDSFFQKTVRGSFEQLGLSSTFRIADESEILPISSEVMDGLIEVFYAKHETARDDASPLSRIESNLFAEVMDHLLSNRSDGKLTSVLIGFHALFSNSPEGIGLLKRFATDLKDHSETEFLETPYGQRLSNALEEEFSEYYDEICRLESDLSFDPEIAQKCSGIISTDKAFCQAILNALQSHSYERLQGAAFSFIPGRFPTIKNKPPQASAYQNFREQFRKGIAENLQATLIWPPEVISNQMKRTADLCEMLYQFYLEYESRLMAEKRTRGILEHNDIRAMLYQLLSNSNGEASDFAKGLSEQYDAVYIDEYQDVDLLQDQIFSLIGGNRRFMVGDIKQSIYGFRGSEPSIFAAYRKKMPLYDSQEAEKADGVCVFMSENFRCDRSVIDFANAICAFLFSACEKSVGYRAQDDLVCSKKQPDGAVGNVPVQVAVFDAQPKRIDDTAPTDDTELSKNEAVWVASEISRLIREERLDDGSKITPSDIAILVRAKAQGKQVVKELEKLNIPASNDMSDSLIGDPLLTDLLNLLQTIDNPYRDIPLSEFLLSTLGGFTPEELIEIRESAPNHKALFDALSVRAEETDALGVKSKEILLWMERLREKATVMPADRFLRLLYLDERLIDYASTPVLLFLYEQARIYQRSSWCGLYGFLNHMEKQIESGKVSADGLYKAKKAVSVMTVHKSKGLEFPVVFLVSCGSQFNKSDTKENLLFHKDVCCASKLYNMQTGESENTILREILKREISDELAEESIRTLYVALTRARERLYVTGTLLGKWEKAITRASTVHRGRRHSILSCNSYLSWVLAALQEAEQKKVEFPCIFQHFSSDELEKGVVLESEKASATVSKEPTNSPSLSEHLADVLKAQTTFQYPLSFLQGLPTKAAASKLEKGFLDIIDDENDEAALETQIELMRSLKPNFEILSDSRKKASPAEIGTATHAFLQFCDFERLAKYGIESERDRLLEQKFLNDTTTSILNMAQLERFLQSDLLSHILSAKKIYREQKFSLFVPFSELTEDPLRAEGYGEHKLFVQGSIDLLLQMPDGKLVLVDYKTDHVTQQEETDHRLFQARMKQAHGTQLSFYARAVRMLFGRFPDQIFIYSLPLGKAVEIDEIIPK